MLSALVPLVLAAFNGTSTSAHTRPEAQGDGVPVLDDDVSPGARDELSVLTVRVTLGVTLGTREGLELNVGRREPVRLRVLDREPDKDPSCDADALAEGETLGETLAD